MMCASRLAFVSHENEIHKDCMISGYPSQPIFPRWNRVLDDLGDGVDSLEVSPVKTGCHCKPMQAREIEKSGRAMAARM
jgi:hypothetical protein